MEADAVPGEDPAILLDPPDLVICQDEQIGTVLLSCFQSLGFLDVELEDLDLLVPVVVFEGDGDDEQECAVVPGNGSGNVLTKVFNSLGDVVPYCKIQLGYRNKGSSNYDYRSPKGQ